MAHFLTFAKLEQIVKDEERRKERKIEMNRGRSIDRVQCDQIGRLLKVF